jgi:serpin B
LHSEAMSRLRSAFVAASSSILALTCACGGGQTGDEQHGDAGSVLQELKGTATRVTADSGFPNSAAQDNWNFGWRMYHQLAQPDQNIFFSPYSISSAVAMLVAGAAGQTKAEIDAAMSFTGDDGTAFHQARNSVAQALDARNHAATQNQDAQALHVSNDLWLDPSFHPSSAFLDTLSAYYGAGAFLAPFSTNPEAARTAINQRVASETQQLIPNLLPAGSIDPAVVFVLTNALYFKSNWSNEFSKDATHDAPFTTASGATASVSMMNATFETGYYSGSDYTVVSLPYFGHELELVAILPSAGTFADYVAQLQPDMLATATSATASLETKNINLSFPKFDITSVIPLKTELQALGMQQAFDEVQANFDDLLGPGVYVSDAFHQATLSIDEQGTEAAAATALVGRAESAPPPPIQVVFDHPFVFFIRDIQTNALLFAGHYAQP